MDEKTYSTLEQIKLGVTLVGAVATTAVAVHSLYRLAKDIKAEKDLKTKIFPIAM